MSFFDSLKENRPLAVGAIAVLLILVVTAVGLAHRTQPAPSMPAATQPVRVTAAAAPSTPETPPPEKKLVSAAAGGEAMLPAAYPITTQLPTGADEEVANGGQDEKVWLVVGRRHITDGQPLATIDMMQTRDATGGQGWGEHYESTAVTRRGLFQWAGGKAVVVLSMAGANPVLSGGRCSVAFGDPSNVAGEGQGSSVASVTLAPGWHWLYLRCITKGSHITANVAMRSEAQDTPIVPSLHMPAAAPAAASGAAPAQGVKR